MTTEHNPFDLGSPLTPGYTTQNASTVQDVVAERVEELFQHYDDIDCAETVDQRITAKEKAELWLTNTLTQLVKEVEAGEEKNIISILENAGYVNVKETLYYHKKPMFVVDKNITPPTSDVIEK